MLLKTFSVSFKVKSLREEKTNNYSEMTVKVRHEISVQWCIQKPVKYLRGAFCGHQALKG